MRERPILAQYRGPAAAPAATPATGGDNLGDLIAQVDSLRHSLSYTWADLTSLCGEDSKTLDRRGLVKLIGDLGAIQREQRHGCL
ncbi:hypothetical protein [Nodosilinea sp. FACHB-13]|uniref:hypothetical protein n=1 Tax=Cyanophyceae TaxID=3028117 RepID=UPI00168603DA|nr:hypothetical protein [Nodosilinea sp. FACHB-13]MBD2107409.1 hypothetical protein [Nodosilinea sp. FACHB-13]